MAKVNDVNQQRDEFNRFVHKYDADKMIPAARKVLIKGGTISMVAAALNVSVSTVRKWKSVTDVDNFKIDFAKMWDEAFAHNAAFYDEIAINQFKKPTRDFNAVLYQMFRRNNHGWTEHRSVAIDGIDTCKNYTEQSQLMRKKLNDGDLTPAEFNILNNSLSHTAMQEVDNLRADIAELKELTKSKGV